MMITSKGQITEGNLFGPWKGVQLPIYMFQGLFFVGQGLISQAVCTKRSDEMTVGTGRKTGIESLLIFWGGPVSSFC